MARKIDILIYEDVVLSSAAAPLDILTRTNDILIAANQPPAFEVGLIARKAETVRLGNPASFNCAAGIEQRPPQSNGHNQSLILIPAFVGTWEEVLGKNRKVLPWLAAHYHSGTELASLCKGSYFLAEAGLLDARPCTSHWAAISDMRHRYPKVDFKADAVITDHNGLYTGGGAFSSLNLLLYLIEKFCGHEIGIQVAKNFSIQRDHENQGHFSIFSGLKQHGDTLILSAQFLIEQNYGKKLSVESVAEHVNMSKRNFIRRFKQALRITPLEYIQRVKIEAAKQVLEKNALSIQALTFEVGYNDTKTFRDTFKKLTGLTPQSYRRKYGR